MASCGLVRWPTHGQGASRELISSCRSAGVVSKQHHGPHHCCGRRRSNAEFESLCSRFVEHASTCTTQPLRSMVSATSMRKRRRGALREAPGSDSVRVPRAAHSSPVKLSIAYGSSFRKKRRKGGEEEGRFYALCGAHMVIKPGCKDRRAPERSAAARSAAARSAVCSKQRRMAAPRCGGAEHRVRRTRST